MTGTVALMRSVYPHMSAAAAKRLLQASADSSGQCRSPADPTLQGCGAGLVDVDAAVRLAQAASDNAPDTHIGNTVHGGYGCAIAGRASSTGALVFVGAALLVLARRRRVL